jgi:hypothetical protein
LNLNDISMTELYKVKIHHQRSVGA